MSTENKEFYDLLSSITSEQTFPLELSPREEAVIVSCKQLTTVQLKELIRAVVDSPITQAVFNSTATKIFKNSLVDPSVYSLNIIDRLLFIIETRIQSLSPTMNVKENDKEITVDFLQIKEKLNQQLRENVQVLAPSSATDGKLTISFGVTLIDTESQLNDELYKNVTPNVEDAEELRKVLGEAFINEIAKSIRTLTIEDKTLDLSTVSFKSRLKVVESLPASLIQKVIEYIEKYKKLIDESLTVDGYTLTIDGTLFSLR